MPKLKTIALNPDAALQELARLQARRIKMAAEADAKISAVKEEAAKNLAPIEQEVKALENQLTNWLKQNASMFADDRSRKTAFGAYGWRKSAAVKIEDEEKLKEFFYQCLAAGVDPKDIGKLEFRPVKEGIKNRLEAGTAVPGCELREKDAPYYEVDQNFVDSLLRGG